jgi:succinoglycan biosynthesis protein ExoL
LHDISKYIDNQSVFYKGEFKSPEDLEMIYKRISISFVMYDDTDINVRLALPNKLYECMYFKRPIIASSNTFLGKRALDLKIGFIWSQTKMVDLVQYLDSDLFVNSYNSLEANFNQISPEEMLLFEDFRSIIITRY